MSTKTTFKRVALVAVAALGLGVLSSVAPATAATATYTVGTPTATVAVTGQVFTVSAPVTFTAAPVSDTATISIATSTSVSSSTVSYTAGTQSDVTVASGPKFTGAVSNSNQTVTITNDATNNVALTTSGTARTFTANFNVSVNKAGTYVFAIIDDKDGSGALTTGDSVQYLTVTVADAPAASVSLSTEFSATYASYAAGAAGAGGAWVKVSVLDAAGAATVLNGSQMVLVNIPSTADLRNKAVSGTPTAVGPISNGSYGLVAADFSKSGVAYINVTGATGTSTVTANIVGATANAASIALTYKAVSGEATTATSLKALDGTAIAAGAAVANGSGVNITANTTGTVSRSATSLSVSIVAAAAQVTGVRVANGSVGSTLYGGGTLFEDVVADTSLATAASTATAATTGTTGLYPATLTIGKTLALQANGAGATIVISPYTGYAAATRAQAFTITGKSTTATKLSLVAPTAATVVAAPAASTTVTLKCVDDFGAARANTVLTPAIAGRNAALVTLPSLVTDASGLATFTYKDASTSTTSLADAVSVTGCGSTTAMLTVNYSSDATFGVSAVKWTAGGGFDDADSYVGANKTAISGADNPSANGATALTFTVKDVNGVAIVGAPYTVALTGSTSALLVKSATVDNAAGFTTSTGVTVTLFGWAPGTSTVTLTVGGKTATGYVTWKNSATTSHARVLSGSYANGVASLKVVDRYGNGIDGIGIALTRTGTGFFANGASTATATTDGNGTVDIQFTGTGTITATLPGGATQALDAAGFINAVAVTAPVAGTTTGTGSTFAPAGVRTITLTADGSNPSVDVAQSAVDAAAEATDAANAATDAANAAAEAADAATAAAQDAADAVAALSTQVSEMIDALKKQITALTNLVIKIQKKVKA